MLPHVAFIAVTILTMRVPINRSIMTRSVYKNRIHFISTFSCHILSGFYCELKVVNKKVVLVWVVEWLCQPATFQVHWHPRVFDLSTQRIFLYAIASLYLVLVLSICLSIHHHLVIFFGSSIMMIFLNILEYSRIFQNIPEHCKAFYNIL